MCGILGAISRNLSLEDFNSALRSIRHRGPDHSAIYTQDSVTIGHNRLAILDLDARSNQPFHLASKRLSMVFNGEIYNYLSIRDKLRKVGHVFQTESDTEVLLAGYSEWGTDLFLMLHGMFAFCICDWTNQKLIIARDRFGEKPLFYCTEASSFYFASELEAVRRLAPNATEIDHSAIIDYLHFGFIPAPKTVFRAINKLEPGCYLEYDLQSNTPGKCRHYYSLRFNEKNNGSIASKIDDFTALAEQVAREISISDVSLGAFLSGGVDSSGSAFFLSKTHSDINTFTAGFGSSRFDETKYAAQVAKTLNLRNLNKLVDFGDFLEEYERMIDRYGEPHNDYSFIPTYLICKEAARHHTVMISGDGADEIFCGYPRFHKLQLFDKIKSVKPLTNLVARVAKVLPEHSNIRRQTIFVNRNEVDFFWYMMSMNFSPDDAPLIYGDCLMSESSHYSPRDLIKGHLEQVDSDSLVQKQRYLDIKLTLADDMLVKVDRASMANSIEVRPFYLHPLVSEFAFSLPASDLVSFRVDKLFLKKALASSLPKETLRRKKMGFTFPLRELITTELRSFFNSSIESLPPEIINSKQIDTIRKRQGHNGRDYTSQLHSLMMLGRWFEKNGVN